MIGRITGGLRGAAEKARKQICSLPEGLPGQTDLVEFGRNRLAGLGDWGAARLQNPGESSLTIGRTALKVGSVLCAATTIACLALPPSVLIGAPLATLLTAGAGASLVGLGSLAAHSAQDYRQGETGQRSVLKSLSQTFRQVESLDLLGAFGMTAAAAALAAPVSFAVAAPLAIAGGLGIGCGALSTFSRVFNPGPREGQESRPTSQHSP